MTDEEWACEWVGWRWYSTGTMWERTQGAWGYRSLPDLAEAVREKIHQDAIDMTDPPIGTDYVEASVLAWIWFEEGPTAFIKAIRELVDGQ